MSARTFALPDANRVPFPFAPLVRERFDLTTVVHASDGPRLCDLDGQWTLDVSGFHPNTPPPNDAALLTSDARKTEESRERYADWLKRLRSVCTAAGVPLVFDEAYTGFRLAPGGAQEYFDVRADMMVYGKTSPAACRSASSAGRAS